MSVAGARSFVPGEPVMITANDYQRGLFNGDQGIVVRADEGLGRHHFRAVFRVGGGCVPFAIEALRDRLELAWALTVHKSQGSEVDAVALVLPARGSPARHARAALHRHHARAHRRRARGLARRRSPEPRARCATRARRAHRVPRARLALGCRVPDVPARRRASKACAPPAATACTR